MRPNILSPHGSVLFPYEGFPWRLEWGETICHFMCIEHLQKHIDRYKIKSPKVLNRDGEPFKSSKKHKAKLRPTTRKSSNRSASTVRKRKSILDPAGDSISNSKRKK